MKWRRAVVMTENCRESNQTRTASLLIDDVIAGSDLPTPDAMGMSSNAALSAFAPHSRDEFHEHDQQRNEVERT
jgi:hypothetical protein